MPIDGGTSMRDFITAPHTYNWQYREQDGAELCQAQDKLGLAKLALPKMDIIFQLPTFSYKLRSSSIYLNIEVVFHFAK